MSKLLQCFSLAIIFLASNWVFGQEKLTRDEYLSRFAPIAVQEMQNTGIPASITLAQGLLESDNGNSMLARKANNHFGIKCHSSWEGKKIFKDDDAKNECFRVYDSAWESFRDHSNFLVNGRRYDFLFEYKSSDYKSWANGLKKAGYATNPKYPDLLIRIIEENNLSDYDKGVSPKKKENPKKEVAKKEEAQQNQVIEQNFDEVIVKIRTSDNGIDFIKMPHELSLSRLAYQLNMATWQFKKYNNVPKSYVFKKGEIVYLQPKKSYTKSAIYTTIKGDTPELISQQFGYKLKKLIKDNNLTKGQEIEAGTSIQLNTKKLPF